MAEETELERMIIRLMGDDDSYQKMLDKAESSTLKTAMILEKAGEKLESAGKRISLAITAPLVGMGAVGLFQFAEEEKALLKLEAAVVAGGRAANRVLPEYKAFAAEIQRTTVVADDAVLKILQTAESLGVQGESAKRAARNAVAMQAAFGMSAEHAIRMTSALEQGRAEMLQRFLPALRGIEDEAEQAALAQDLLAKAFTIAQAETQTFSGRLAQLKNQMGDASEEIGMVIANGLTPLIEKAKEATTWFQNLSPATKELIVTVGALAAAVGPVLVGLGLLTSAASQLITAYAVVRAAVTVTALASAAGFAVAYALAAVAVVGIYKMASAMYEVNAAVSNFNMQMAESVRLSKELGEGFNKKTGGILEQSRGMPEGEKKDFLADQIQLSEKNVQGLSDQVRGARARVDELNTAWKNATGNKILAEARQELAQTEDNLTRNRDRLQELRTEFDSLKGAVKKAFDPKELDKFTESLKVQSLAFEQNSRMAEIQKFALQGATNAQLKAALSWDEALTAQEKQRGINKFVDDTISRLEIQADTMNLTSAAAEMYKATMMGATDAQIEAIGATARQVEIAKKQQDAMKRAADITKQYATPFEKYEEKVNELNDLLDSGKISQETYGRAVEDAEKQLNKAAEAHKKVGHAMKDVDAAAVGSSEAMSRLLAFQGGKRIGTDTPELLRRQSIVGTTGPAEGKSEKSLENVVAKLGRLVELTEQGLQDGDTLELVPADIA